LQRQWHTFDTALSHTPDFTYIFDRNGRFTYINRALLSLWQLPLEAAVGKNFFELNYPEDLAARLQAQIQQVIETKGVVRDNTPYTGPTGETRYYEYIFVPVFAPDGSVEAVTGSTRDVTDRVHIEQALAASELKLQQVFAQAPVAIVAFRGENFVVEMANPLYHSVLPGRELVGRPFAEVVPDLGQEVWDVLRGVMTTGVPFVANEWLVPFDQNGDGVPEDHWFNVVYHPLREVNGDVTGLIAVLTDVTGHVLTRMDLERANRDLAEFAYVASHDLQEPLRMVNMYTQMLVRRFGQGDEQVAQYAGIVQEGVTRMGALLRDLLAYSRSTHANDTAVGTADLGAALVEATAMVAGRIQETGAVILADPLPMVKGDTGQLALVLQNVIGNALKYRSQETPQVRITASRNEDIWTISVRDNGIGFDQEYAERIFGLFKRLHSANDYPGTGLGLAICQRIVERFGGRMWATSSVGQGATFSFALHVPQEQ
jgi:PAS domain S-box-containing protein